MFRASLVAIAISAAVLGGCDRDKADLKDVSVASIGNEKLTTADFEAYLKLKGIPNTPGNRLDRAKKTFEERTAMAAAIAKEPLLDRTAIEAELRDFRNELLITRYFEKYTATKITPEAVKQYYDQNPDKFTQRRAYLAHILLRLTPDMDDGQRKAQFAKAVELYNKIKAGATFESVAKQSSEDPVTANNGGDMGWMPDQQIERAIADLAFKLKKGEITQPVNTPSGYHIVKAIEDPVVERKPFEEVKDAVRYRLQVDEKSKETERLVSSVTKKEIK